ncbi:MAG: hypothetical protein MHM6MM_003969 [Cercozoa sp. M6MM]
MSSAFRECESLLKATQEEIGEPFRDSFVRHPKDTLPPDLWKQYKKKIAHATCLNDVSHKLTRSEYRTVREFLAELRLVFVNCTHFVKAGTPYNDEARKMLTWLHEQQVRIEQQLVREEARRRKSVSSDEVQLREERAHFVSLLRSLRTPEEFVEIMESLKQQAPEALTDPDADNAKQSMDLSKVPPEVLFSLIDALRERVLQYEPVLPQPLAVQVHEAVASKTTKTAPNRRKRRQPARKLPKSLPGQSARKQRR